MANDKEIFELPEATVALLMGASQVGFVAQVSGYDYDFQVSPQILASYLGTGKPIVFVGATNPDPAIGSSGDIYFKTDGNIYQKVGNGWQLKGNIPTGNPAPRIIELTSGQTIPYSFSLPANFNGKYKVDIKIDRGGDLWESYPSAKIVDLLDTSAGINNYFINRVDIYGVESAGTNIEHLLFTFSKA